MQVLFWDAVGGVVCCSGGAVRGAGVQLLACILLSGVYAGVLLIKEQWLKRMGNQPLEERCLTQGPTWLGCMGV